MQETGEKHRELITRNEDEGARLSGQTEPREILRVMTKNYAGAEVILTLGVQAFFDGGKGRFSNGACRPIRFPAASLPADAGEWDK